MGSSSSSEPSSPPVPPPAAPSPSRSRPHGSRPSLRRRRPQTTQAPLGPATLGGLRGLSSQHGLGHLVQRKPLHRGGGNWWPGSGRTPKRHLDGLHSPRSGKKSGLAPSCPHQHPQPPSPPLRRLRLTSPWVSQRRWRDRNLGVGTEGRAGSVTGDPAPHFKVLKKKERSLYVTLRVCLKISHFAKGGEGSVTISW